MPVIYHHNHVHTHVHRYEGPKPKYYKGGIIVFIATLVLLISFLVYFFGVNRDSEYNFIVQLQKVSFLEFVSPLKPIMDLFKHYQGMFTGNAWDMFQGALFGGAQAITLPFQIMFYLAWDMFVAINIIMTLVGVY